MTLTLEDFVLVAIAEYHSSNLASGICTNQILDDLPRTNNAVKGWHRSFQANVGAYHPNFWKFIDILKREQNSPKSTMPKLEPVISQNLKVAVIWTANRGSKTSSKTTTTVTSCSIFGLSPQHQHVKNTSSHVSALCQPKRFF